MAENGKTGKGRQINQKFTDNSVKRRQTAQTGRVEQKKSAAERHAFEQTAHLIHFKKAYAIQAGRELRVMVKPEEVDDVAMKVIARDMAQKIEEDVKYPGQIKVHIIRESRAVDYAK